MNIWFIVYEHFLKNILFIFLYFFLAKFETALHVAELTRGTKTIESKNSAQAQSGAYNRSGGS